VLFDAPRRGIIFAIDATAGWSLVVNLVKNTRLKDVLAQASQKLNHRLEAEMLIAHALQQDRAHLYAHGQTELTETQLSTIYALIKRRQLGEPIAYLLGHKEFYGRSFVVTPMVLIPRPETEMIIDQAKELPLPHHAKVLDVGTGSGCIGLTLAAEHPTWIVCVSDCSAQALSVCQQNRQAFNLTNVVMQQGDLLGPWRGQRFDLIVANLPYIAPDDPHLSQGDLRHEPTTALVADQAGLSLIHQLIEQAPNHLNPGASLILEHGHDQQPMLEQALQAQGFVAVCGLQDLAGQPRLVMGRWDAN